uniref:Uncharacterized protein n=1 Tax=Ditylenchus dipsaci TaxID=166011 RepID=A0A915EQX6_9BILA
MGSNQPHSHRDLVDSLAEHFRKLGNEQFKVGKYEEAVNLYTKSLAKVKSWEAFSNRAAAYLKLERFHLALQDCAQVVTIDKKNFKGLFRMAQALFGMKQNVGAVMECKNCLELWPGHPDVIKLLNDIKDYEKRSKSSQFQILFVAPSFIELTTVDFEVLRFNSWKQLIEKLRTCHTPIKRVDIAEYFDEDAMDQWIFPRAFRWPFGSNKHFLCGVIGVDSATFCHALNNFSCFRKASFVNIFDPIQQWNKTLTIEISAVFSFLHSFDRNHSQLIIDYHSLDMGIEVLWDMLVEKFVREKRKSSYSLKIQCPKKLMKPKECRVHNLKTSEVLLVRTDSPNLFALDAASNDYSSGFVLSILGQCEFWSIVIIPLLTESFEQAEVLKQIVATILKDCKWYAGYIDLEFLTKDNTFIHVRDPTDLSAVNKRLKYFKYNEEEREDAYIQTVGAAIDKMDVPSRTSAGHGQFIFVITNFARIDTGADGEFLRELNRLLLEKEIQLRNVRLEFDGRKGTEIPMHFLNIQQLHNLSSNIMRVSLVETNNVVQAMSPCPSLSAIDIIKQYHAIKKFYAETWLEEHKKESVIGLLLLVLAILFAVMSFVFSWWERRTYTDKKLLDTESSGTATTTAKSSSA